MVHNTFAKKNDTAYKPVEVKTDQTINLGRTVCGYICWISDVDVSIRLKSCKKTKQYVTFKKTKNDLNETLLTA